MSETLKLHRVN